MKKWFALLLGILMLMSAFACTDNQGKPDAPKPGTDAGPTATAAPAATPTEEPVPYWVYDYAYGHMKITVSKEMPDAPADDGKSVTFTDPNGKWTASFKPLTVHETEINDTNLHGSIKMKQDFGYYRNVITEDRTGVYADDAIKVTYFAFERNPDWVASKQGYTTGAQEAHAYWLFDFGDVFIGPWGGLLIEVALPEKSTDPLEPVLSDENLLMLIDQNDFIAGASAQEISVPGIAVSFPARWNASSDGDHTIWASIGGATRGSIFFSSSVYADPKVAAGYVASDYRTVTFNGRTWYGAVRTSTLSESTIKGLELFTEFTEFHALSMKLNLVDWTGDDDFWNFLNTEAITAVMESVVTDPASFHNPEDDRRDASGFEANNIHELSAYRGTESEIVIPAVVGTTDIVGINTDLFKGNATLTSVVISEGIQYIEYGAFRDCPNLKSVVLPNSLTYIDYRAFENCTALESVAFGNGLVTIDKSAFAGCTSLGDVLLPETVAKIADSAFNRAGSGKGRFSCPASGTVYGSAALCQASFRSVEIGSNAVLSEQAIMQSLKAESVTIGEGCTALGEYFLQDPYNTDTVMQSITLPDTILSVGNYAFAGRLGVKEINLGRIETAGRSAFYHMGLVNIVVPGTLKNVPDSCFANCPDVISITIGEGVESADEWAFSECGRRYYKSWSYDWYSPEEAAAHPEFVPNGTEPFDRFVTVTVPSTLQKTGYGAFCGMFVNVYMLWVTAPDQFPTGWDTGTFASAYVGQIYFTEETIAAYGTQLDQILNGFDKVGESAWYYNGKDIYWAEYK